MNELQKLEQQADVLLRLLEVNSKKARQQKLKEKTGDMKRIDANLRIIHELRDLDEMINARAMADVFVNLLPRNLGQK